MHKSFRGKEIDMVALAAKNEKKMAIGNAKMNSRGDIVGKGGKILKTREQQIKEYMETSKLQQGLGSMRPKSQEEMVAEELKSAFSKPTKVSAKKKKEEPEEKKAPEVVYDDEEEGNE